MADRKARERRGAASGGVPHPFDCESLRPLLFDYMSRELGDSRSALVREHVAHCAACRAELVAIEQAVADLRAGVANERAGRLSERRRKRLMRLAANPLLNWFDQYHRLVAFILTFLVLLLVLGALRLVKVQTFEPTDPGETIPIWRYFRSGPLPQRVAEAAARQREQEREAVDNRDQ